MGIYNFTSALKSPLPLRMGKCRRFYSYFITDVVIIVAHALFINMSLVLPYKFVIKKFFRSKIHMFLAPLYMSHCTNLLFPILLVLDCGNSHLFSYA